jgi:light-regulated signal transduction histidine kinase (bacteriophytochrome)
VSHPPVDLNACDTEQIQFIGAVQPHGALIAVETLSRIIRYASVNSAAFIGYSAEELLGKKLEDLIGANNAAQMPDLRRDAGTPEMLKPWFLSFTGPDSTVIEAECLPHSAGDHIILEFLTVAEKPAPVWEDELLRQGIITNLIRPASMLELAQATAQSIREVTGFDRVMIYKFAEDKHGEVIAESTNRPDSFLGQHYPASDIPEPARRHFVLNLIRTIPDIEATPAGIVSPHSEAPSAPLDLTFSKLRAVAPVHIEYLRNMGVRASMSISLVSNNALWGLIACHNYSGPRQISSSRLRFAELVGSTTSALLQSMENTHQLAKSIAAEKAAHHIEQQVRSGRTLADLIADQADGLMQMMDTQGVVRVLAGAEARFGVCPDVLPDYTALRAAAADGVATTQELSEYTAMDENQIRNAAGAALLELSDDGSDYLVFLRSNFSQTIRWAGKPEKAVTTGADGVMRLSPRGSFALWQEEREGQSKPFDATDKDALRILRRAFFALNSLEREKAALSAQKAAEAEEMRLRHALLDAARASSLGELAAAIAHELNQPLSAVANYVNACRQEIRNAGVRMPLEAETLIGDALAETARAGDLVRRIRDFITRGDLNTDYIDVIPALRQGMDLAIASSSLPGLKVEVVSEPDLPQVLADPVQIGQVVLNLVRNSISAMAKSPVQVLTVTVGRDGKDVQVLIRDTGPGISRAAQKHIFEPFHASTTKGMGIGLSLCRSIVEAHGGRIWVEPSNDGAVIGFTIPAREGQDGRSE